MNTKLIAIWGALRRNRARVFLNHSISDSPADPLAVAPRAFAEQMAWLSHNDYNVITAGELVHGLAQGRRWHRTVVLTFDDGFDDFHDVAMPILRERDFRATVFVPTGCLGQTSRWNVSTPPRPVMTEAQLARVVEAGHELGSHTVSHASLPSLDESALAAELCDSRDRLRQFTGSQPQTLAYPFGRAAAREQAAAERAGYAGAFIVGGLWGNGLASDRYALTREMLTQRASLAQFQKMVSGMFDLAHLSGRLVAWSLNPAMN